MTGVEVLPSVGSVVAWANNLTPDELRKVFCWPRDARERCTSSPVSDRR